jgi:hypothetical protein
MNPLNNCLRHRRYATKDAAQAEAARLRNKRSHKGVRAFPCKIGGVLHYHVGRNRRRP